MRMVGLTGGIASGKSTVSAMLRELGAEIIDADQVARDVVAPGTPALAEISERFPGVVSPDGTLDRAALGRRVFSSDDDRATLNAITHPRIQAAVQERTEAHRARGVPRVVYDAALLMENGLHAAMDGGVILVAASEDTQRARLVARDGLTPEEAEARIRSQLPLEAKRRHARWVIENDGDLDSLRAQVERTWREVTA
ncbi:MAG: dephospho-CoA kinase [Deltaproteobacteria bacterium]|nr:dephospho-CoA kinase [Deltaproteobacteria bacterium]